MMSELEYLAEISEKLDLLTNRLDILIFMGVFAIAIHYAEKWLKIAMSQERR